MITVDFICSHCGKYRGLTMNSHGFMLIGNVELEPCRECNTTAKYRLSIKEVPDDNRPHAGLEVHIDRAERNELIDCHFLP